MQWKRINSDVSQCYFQATRLIIFVHDELLRFFTHQFISQRSLAISEDTLDDGTYLTTAALGLAEYLEKLKRGADKWIATCSNFLEMANDFLEFVKSYHVNDAIGIEYGYHKHLPVFKVLGQNKYVEICFGQNGTLYKDAVYS